MKKGFLLSTSSSSSGKKTSTRIRVDVGQTKKKRKDNTNIDPQWNKGFLLSPKNDTKYNNRKEHSSLSHDNVENGSNLSPNSQPQSSSNQILGYPQKENGKLQSCDKDLENRKIYRPENDVTSTKKNLVECSPLKNDTSSWQKGFLLTNTKSKKLTSTTTDIKSKEHCKNHQTKEKKKNVPKRRKSLQKNSCSDLLSFEDDSKPIISSDDNLFHIQLINETVQENDEGNDQKLTNMRTDNSTNPTLGKQNHLLLPLEEETTSKNDDWMISPIQTKRTIVKSEPFLVPAKQQEDNGNTKFVTNIDHALGQWTRSFERRKRHPDRPQSSNNLSYIILNWIGSNLTSSNEQLWIETIFYHSTLLRLVASHAKDKFQIEQTEKWWFDLPPCLQLGVVVLNKYTRQACEVCNKVISSTKYDKLRKLGVTVLWKFFFQFSNMQDMTLCQSFLVPHALPQLMKNIAACSDDKKPTMLSVSNMDASLSIYHYVAKTWHHCCTNKEDVLEFSKTLLWDGPWNQMIVILGHWAALRKKKHPLRPSIVEDFKSINRRTHNPSNPQEIESGCFYFCQSILGDGSSMLGGGLISTMCLGVNCVDTRDVSVHEAYQNLEKVQHILPSDKPENITQVCNLIRGFISWIDKRKINAQTKEPKWCLDVIKLCIHCLRYDQPRPIQLIMTILGYFWDSNSEAFSNSTDDASQNYIPFDILLDELKLNQSKIHLDGNSDEFDLEPSTKALCVLVSRYILKYQSKVMLQKVFLCDSISASTAEILIRVLNSLSNHQLEFCNENKLSENSKCDKKDHKKKQAKLLSDNQNLEYSESESDNDIDLQENMIYDHLLKILGVNKYFQKRLNQTPGLFSKAPMKKYIPRLISILLSNNASSNPKLTSAVCASISDTLITSSSTRNKAEECIKIILMSSKSVIDTEKESEKISHLFQKYGPVWRKHLLYSLNASDDGYSHILAASAHSMFHDPSSSSCLSLFGALIDNESQRLESDDDFLVDEQIKSRIRKGVWDLICIGLDNIKVNYTDLEERCNDDSHRIFKRLAPLLMLRRISYYNFQLFYQDLKDGYLPILLRLNKFILVALGVVDDPHSIDISLSREERRLTTEILVRCFPFSCDQKRHELSKIGCCFDTLCKPAFRKLEDEIFLERAMKRSYRIKDLIQKAKTSLYAMCHFLSIASEIEDSECIMITFKFATKILSFSDQTLIHDELFMQLQTGCIDTIAIFLVSYSTRRHKSKIKSNHSMKTLVCEVTNEQNKGNYIRSTCPQGTRRIMTALSKVFVLTLETVTGNPSDIFLGSSYNATNKKNLSSNISVRTCLFNSLIVASQKFMINDGGFDVFATLTTPTILMWYLDFKDESEIYHPFCVAAAMQFLFIVVTKSKSLKYFFLESDGSDSMIRIVTDVFRLTTKIIKISNNNDQSRELVRIKAFKLLLSVISIDQISSHGQDYISGKMKGFLSPQELNKAFSIIKGAAHMDESAEVRKLANAVLLAIHIS